MRKLNSSFTTKYISEAGTKKKNKDYFGFVELDEFACWAVAESYDNDLNIVSAQVAVDTVLAAFTKKPSLSKRKLKKYIREADRQLKEQSSQYNLKSSIMIVATDYKRIRYALCGNCRLHIFRGDNIFFKSSDQSLYQHMIEQGDVANDEQEGMQESQNLFDYLGKKRRIRIETSKKIMLSEEDIILLTTWGFWEKISTVEMLDALEGKKEPLEFLDELQDLFLSKQGKKINNYTLASIFVRKTFQEKDNKKKIITIILVVVIVLLIIGIVLFIYFYTKNKNRVERLDSIVKYEQNGDMFIDDVNYERALQEYDTGIKESEALKEKKGKKGIENREVKERLEAKQRTAQLIVDGDVLLQEKDFEKAKKSYEKALKEAKYDIDFYELVDIEDIESKIALCLDLFYIRNFMSIAASQADLGNYDLALRDYEEAKKLAAKNSDIEAEQDIRLKIQDIESKLKGEEKEILESALNKKISSGEAIELSGDKADVDGDYYLAISLYEQALSIFIETAAMEKASAVQTKISEVNSTIKENEKSIKADIAAGHVYIADESFSENNFDEAIRNYNEAKSIYTSIMMPDEIAVINEKISLVKLMQKELEKEAKTLDASFIETEGDSFLKKAEYDKAREKYRQAQALYQSLNQTDKILTVEEKVKSIEAIEADKAAEDEEALRRKKIFYAQIMEGYGNQALEEENKSEALEYYESAKSFYLEADEYDKAISVQDKIFELKK